MATYTESDPNTTNNDNNKKKLSKWIMPSPMINHLSFWDTFFPLRITNGLTRTKVPFIPLSIAEGRGTREVAAYFCGPTVYDSSHMGHARTYLCFDILRRILNEYFNYDVTVHINITDIDDKIILRSQDRNMTFRELAKKYEIEYFEDMKSLDILEPDILTRVTEYIPEIIEFVENLVNKGIAYEVNGSVYFSVSSFEKRGYDYAKLVPEAVGNEQLLDEGEGALANKTEKKDSADFVLWKGKKTDNEPSWVSPWGEGRPGWHIECSVVTEAAFKHMTGGKLDIHGGGVDLKFPHNDNEMAQSEAKLDTNQWVNYWVHAGHLHIKGLKMSKSLKNFITIREALQKYTSRQMRLCFLLHKYNAPMDFSDNVMMHAVDIEKTFNEFFHSVKYLLRNHPSEENQRITDIEDELLSLLAEAKTRVRNHLCDDFDTPSVITVLQELVKEGNRYLSNDGEKISFIMKYFAEYITYIFKIFGLIPNGIRLGFPISSDTNQNREEILTPYLNILAKFREDVRQSSKSGDTNQILNLCDQLRDEILPNVGVRLEDKGGDELLSIWKLEDPELLKQERQNELEIQEKKQEERERMKKAKDAKDAQAQIPPNEWIRQVKNDDGSLKYSQFGDDNIPTHNGEGDELNKSQTKKAKKLYQKQEKLHQKFLISK